jgi:hypothetical protein
VAENPPEKHGYNVIERTCRIMFDVNIRISEITPESVAGYFTPDEAGEGLTWEWAERQNRLLSALLKDDESLDQFLVGIIRSDLELLLDSRQSEGKQVDEGEDRLFEKVFSKMSSEDAVYFKEAMRDGLFPENIELFDKAFVIDWKGADVEDVRVLKRIQPGS